MLTTAVPVADNALAALAALAFVALCLMLGLALRVLAEALLAGVVLLGDAAPP